MIPIVGWIIGVYCMARLLQVPIEHGKAERVQLIPLWLISIVGIGVIGILCLALLVKSSSTGASINSIVR
jgi:hypothetical protein